MRYFLAIFIIISAFALGFRSVSAGGGADSGDSIMVDVGVDFALYDPLVDTASSLFKGNVSVLEPVFEKMKQLRYLALTDSLNLKADDRSRPQEKLTILHIGDSHIQAGYLTDAARRNFQRDFGDAGRGLVMPLKISGTNEPTDYTITSPNNWAVARSSEWTPRFGVGLGGMAISTNQKTVEFTIKSYHDRFDQVRVFHHPQAPLVKADSVFMIGSVCDFTSTAAMTHLPLNGETDSVVLRAYVDDQEYATPIFYGFSLENGHDGVVYHSIGVNGCSYEHYNRSPQIMEQIALLEADVIVVSLGTNDAVGGRRFSKENSKKSIKKFVETLRAGNPDAVIVLVTPMESYTRNSVNANIAHVRDNIVDVAGELGLPYWDMYGDAGGKGAMALWYKTRKARADRLHMTQEGYTLQGDMLYSVFINSYNNYLSPAAPNLGPMPHYAETVQPNADS